MACVFILTKSGDLGFVFWVVKFGVEILQLILFEELTPKKVGPITHKWHRFFFSYYPSSVQAENRGDLRRRLYNDTSAAKANIRWLIRSAARMYGAMEFDVVGEEWDHVF